MVAGWVAVAWAGGTTAALGVAAAVVTAALGAGVMAWLGLTAGARLAVGLPRPLGETLMLRLGARLAITPLAVLPQPAARPAAARMITSQESLCARRRMAGPSG